MIMETGFNWNETRKDGYAGQLKDSDVYKDIYPPTMTGHKNFMAELFNELKSVDDNRCLGVLYWDPCMIHVEDKDNKNASLSGWAVKESDDKTDVNVVENTTLFDFDGKAIPSVDVYNILQAVRKKSISKLHAMKRTSKHELKTIPTVRKR